MRDYILFKNIDHEYLTLKDCIAKNGGAQEAKAEEEKTEASEGENTEEKAEEKKVTIYYVTDEQQQSQYINMFKQEGLDAVLLTHNIDSPFVTQLVIFQCFAEYISQCLCICLECFFFLFCNFFFECVCQICIDTLEVKVEKLKNENVASMVTLSEQSRRMQEMMKMYNMYGMDPSMFGTDVTLVLNANHPLVQYVLKNKDGEHVPMFCKQLFDLAMLSKKPLNPEEMTAFINRSNEIMMLLAK